MSRPRDRQDGGFARIKFNDMVELEGCLQRVSASQERLGDAMSFSARQCAVERKVIMEAKDSISEMINRWRLDG